MKDFRELTVWKKSHELTLLVYRSTAVYPNEELFGLTSQTRRACSSIPANIAEGCGRSGDVEFARFLQIAMGSASELDYHLLLAKDLGLLEIRNYEQLADLLVEIKKMLNSFIQKLKLKANS
jgi:four helix bundle protein